MPLSERVRPDCEVAPWVIPEIKQLEAEVERLRVIEEAYLLIRAVVKAAEKEVVRIACAHQWSSMKNEVILSGEWCPKCGSIRAAVAAEEREAEP